jgi:VIT1/CCC1 family predicted Fe2+/Mn2+ transporter
MIKESLRKGFGFGLTSGIITTIGLMVGLYSGTNSEIVVIGGILTIALADSFSDALGIHISEEFEAKHSGREVWEATISTFVFKFLFSSIFIVPVLLFELLIAITVSIVFGLLLIGGFSFKFAKSQNANPWKATVEHLLVTVTVIFITYYAGFWVATFFS